MPLVDSFARDGLKRTLDIITGNWGTLKVHLFKNDHQPAVDDNVSVYTEADFSGYAPVVMANPTPAASAGDFWVDAQYDDVTFRHDGGAAGNDVYGFYITQQQGMGTPVLLYARRFPNVPVRMSQFADFVTLVLQPNLRGDF